MKIFIIDDNSLHLKMCEFILKKQKHEVHLFKSIEELDKFVQTEDTKPDIFFIDYRLSDTVTGIDVLEVVKNKYKWVSAKCVAFTADVSEAAQLRKKGFTGVILKPITEAMLKETVSKFSR
jgi:DNA-binding NtrC family response regulator